MDDDVYEPSPDYEHLAKTVRQWRAWSGQSQNEVSAAGGPSDNILSKIELGTWRSSRPAKTLAKLDIAFARDGWPRGAATRILFDGMAVTPPKGNYTFANKNPSPDVDPDPTTTPDTTVGAVPDHSPGYVRGPGEKVEGGASDDAVLRAIQQMQEDLRAMSERLARLEGDSS